MVVFQIFSPASSSQDEAKSTTPKLRKSEVPSTQCASVASYRAAFETLMPREVLIGRRERACKATRIGGWFYVECIHQFLAFPDLA